MTRFRILLAAVLLTLPAALPAQTPPPADAEVHQALRHLKETMTKALNDRDLATIVANVDPNVVFTTMNGDVCRGPGQIRAYFEKMLNGPGHVVKDVKVSFDADALTTLYGGTTGVAYGSSNDHYVLTNGQSFDIHGRWSCTMVKSGGRWLIASFHYSTNVFNNPILDRMKSLYIAVAVGIGIVALLVGLVVGHNIGGRRAAA